MKKAVVLAALIAAVSASAIAAPKPKAAPVAAKPAGPPVPGPKDWRTPDPNDILVIDTNKGRIIVEMVAEVAPETVARVRELALQHFYDGLTFFRVIDGFMDQTGDPENSGKGGSALPDIKGEFTFRRDADTPFVLVNDLGTLEHGFIKSVPMASQNMSLAAMTADGKVKTYPLFCPGVVGMARAEDPNSNNSQFFLMRDVNKNLEQKYTAWGRVISGQDVVLAIKTGEPVADPQDRMERVRLLSDMPAKDRPKIRILDPKGPWLKAEAARLKLEKGIVFSACDVNIPVEVK